MKIEWFDKGERRENVAADGQCIFEGAIAFDYLFKIFVLAGKKVYFLLESWAFFWAEFIF